MNRSHEQTKDLLPEYLAGSLSEGLAEEVSEHITRCGECAGELAVLREISNAGSFLSEDEDPGDEFWRELNIKAVLAFREKKAEKEKKEKRFAILKLIGSVSVQGRAAAAAAVAVLALLLYHPYSAEKAGSQARGKSGTAVSHPANLRVWTLQAHDLHGPAGPESPFHFQDLYAQPETNYDASPALKGLDKTGFTHLQKKLDYELAKEIAPVKRAPEGPGNSSGSDNASGAYGPAPDYMEDLTSLSGKDLENLKNSLNGRQNQYEKERT